MAAFPPQPFLQGNGQPIQSDPRFGTGPPIPNTQPLLNFGGPPVPAQGFPPDPFYPQLPIPPVPQNDQFNKLWALAFLAAAVVVLVMAIVDLLLSEWVEWCTFKISLTDISSNAATMSLSDFVTGCNVAGLSNEYVPHCGNLCSIANKFKIAGTVMRVVGAFAIALTGVSALYLLACLFLRNLKIKLIFKISLITGAALWVIGMVIYSALFADVVSLASSTKLEGGAGLAIAVTVLFVLLTVVGLTAEKKFDLAIQQQT